MKRNIKTRKCIACIAGIVFIGVLIAFFVVKGKSQKYFADGTVLNGIDVSKMTLEELNQRIGEYSIEVIQKDKEGNTFSGTIYGKDAAISIGKNEDAVKKVLKQQGIWQYLMGKGEKHTIDNWISYDEEKLRKAIRQLNCFDQTQMQEPQNASISKYNKAEGNYQIIPENNGNVLKEKKAEETILEAVHELEKKVDLTREDCYEVAEVTSEDEVLQKQRDTMNTYVKTTITYQFGDSEEVVDGSVISKWLRINKNDKVVFRKKKIAEYVATLRRKYDTIFRSRKFKTSYGKTVTVEGGDYGWWMDYRKEEKELLKQIKAGKSGERTPEYYQTAESYGPKDYGNSYIEINLAMQHVFLYLDGKKVWESDCVTGNSARGFDTPVGTYGITYKEENATLVGENYATPVKYWMPFNGNIGLHDASWRSRFGGEEYKRNGSHGCVNLPPENAKELFKYVEKGMPVICYEYQPEEKSEKVGNEDAKKQTAENR